MIAPKAEEIFSNRRLDIENNIQQAQNYSDQVKSINLHREEVAHYINESIKDMQQQATESIEAFQKITSQELKTRLAKLQEQQDLTNKEYMTAFNKEKSASIVKLAEIIIEKITNNKADSKILNSLQLNKVRAS